MRVKPVAVDAMGGDAAPLVVVEGVLAAARQECPVLLFGPISVILPMISALEPDWPILPIKLEEAPDLIKMGDSPTDAVRRGGNSSMVMGIKSLAAGRCSAFVSAGNSGAVVVAATLLLGRRDGVIRPAIGANIPCRGGSVFMIDIGGNVDCRPEHLVQFAKLGVKEVRRRGLLFPRIGLLCNGSEPSKGSLLVKEAHRLLKAEFKSLFVGNVEPRDLIDCKIEVVVTDGFTGNLVLKTIEALVAWLNPHKSSEAGVFGCQNSVDGGDGGAQLFGLRGVVVIAHGSSTADDMRRAILYAHASGSCAA